MTVKMKSLQEKELSASRIEGFSDAFIAIVITLMVLEISLPENMNISELLTFGKSIVIYFASFIIVGAQWAKHHFLLNNVETVSQKFVFKNLLCLFLMSLIPIFMKWLLEYPTSVIPAMAYSVLYLVNDWSMRWLLKEKMEAYMVTLTAERSDKRNHAHSVMLFVFAAIFAGTLIGSFFHPEIAIICFIALPVVMSLLNVFAERVR